jgi:hypothetical protein
VIGWEVLRVLCGALAAVGLVLAFGRPQNLVTATGILMMILAIAIVRFAWEGS